MVITGDDAGHMVIVSATPDRHELISKVIKDMDEAHSTDQVTVKVYRLQQADANSVASALTSMLGDTRTAGTPGPGRRPAAGGTGSTRISADPSTASLVVRATKDEHDRIAKLLVELDTAPGAKFPIQTIPLVNADATNVAGILTRVFSQQAARTGRQGAPGATAGQTVLIEGDRDSRLLTVRADDETFQKIRALVAQLDAAPPATASTPTVITLKNAQAPTVAAVLQQAFAPQRTGPQRGNPDDQVTVVGEPFSNSVVITANAKRTLQVVALLEKLDVDTETGAKTEFLILKNAKAVDLAAALGKVTTGGAPGPRRPAGPAAPASLTIAADAGSNALIFSGPSVDVEKMMKLALKLDEVPGALALETKILILKNAQASTVAPAITSAFAPARGVKATAEDSVTAIAEPGSNAVLVTAGGANMKKVEALVAQIDNENTPGYKTEFYVLKNAKATDLAAALSKVLTNSGLRTRNAPGQQGVQIAAEPSTNSIVVSGPSTDLEKVKKIVEEMDKTVAMTGVETKLITLKNAQSTTVAPALTQAYAPKGKTVAPEDIVTVVAEPNSNSVVVTATALNMKKVEDLIAQIDTIEDSGTKTDFYVLKKARATDVANTLSKVVANVGVRGAARPGQGTQGGVVISAEPGGNVLVFSGPAADLEKLRKLIQELDNIVPENATDTKVIALKNGQAASVAQALTGAFVAPKGKTANPEDQVTVVAEVGSNSVVVTASALNMKKVEDLVKILDAGTEGRASVYTIQLKNGDAYTMAAMVRDLFTQTSKGQKQSDPLGVTADDRANALVLATTKEIYEKVSEWVAKLEEMKPARGNLRLIQIQNADPADVDRAIKQLYNLPGAPGPAGAPATPGPRRPNPAGTSGTTTGGRVETTVLPGQKSIMINANDEDFAEIQKIIKQMEDQALAAKREIKVFTLKNASNLKVATALDQVYRQPAGTGKTVAPADLVTVQALAQTNAVVIAAAKEKMAEISALIDQLDKQENSPQVEYRIYPLANALPSKVLPAMKTMLAPLQKMRPEDAINVEANDATRSIIISARGQSFDQIGKIIEALDKAPDVKLAKTDVVFIQLKHADAKLLAAVLSDMLRPDPAGQLTPEARSLQEQIRLLNIKAADADKVPELDLTKPIKITADAGSPQGSNTLVVNSTEENVKALRAIIDSLDVVPLADGVVMRLVHLQNSDAATMVTVLKDIFTQGKQLAGRAGTTVVGKADPISESGKGLVNPLGVSADLRTNTLILAGQQETIALAEVLLKDLDRNEGKIVTEVRLFKLKNADAAKIAPMLLAVFNETAAVPGSEGVRTQVTRLKTVLDKQQGTESVLPKGRTALVIQADPSTNILIVAARNDVMPLIADVVSTMDIPGAGSLNTVRFFPLENADATRLQTVITSMFTGPNAQNVRAEDKPTISVDTRTNSLIIAASDKTFGTLDALLVKLDAKLPLDMRDIKLIPLKNASSDTLAASLQKIMDARVQRLATMSPKETEALKVIILSDPRSNSLMVGGSAEGFELVKSLAQQLDDANPALGGQMQIFPLANGNAGTISTTLANLFNQRYAAAKTPDIQRQKPVILPDLRTNVLLVAANDDDTKALKALLEKLDVKIVDPTIQLIVLPMKFNDAGTVGTMIRTIFASRLTAMTPPGTPPDPTNRVDVATEPLSNALIVSASKDNIEMIKGLLEKVDIEPPSDNGIVKIYMLKTADATSTMTLLSGLVKQGLYKPGLTSAGNNPAIVAREKVSLVADIRTNTIIVSASKENMAVIEQILKELDTDVAALMGDVRIYTLQRADATKLGALLQQFFNAKRAGELSVNNQIKTVPVVVVADNRTNSILVTGGKDSFAAVEDMIKKLDGEDVTSINDFKVFYLKNATASAVQPMLTQLFTQRATRGTGPKDPITVIADPKNNALIVGATLEDMKLAENLISKLDVPETNGSAMQVFALKKANAIAVAATIKSLMSAGATPGAGPAAAGLSISTDDRTNSLIVSAGASDMERIKELIAKLDLDTVAKVSEIRVYTLANADAKELGTVLTDVLTSKPKSAIPDNSNRQQLLQFITHTQEGKDLIASGLQEGVTITPDSRTNSLIVSAPLEFIPLLDSLIKALDQTSPRIAEIRMFALINADATQMATVLTQLFRLQQANAANAKAVTYTLVSTQPANGTGTTPKADPSAVGPSATVGNAEQAALTVTVDVRTNSLLVGGTKQYVELASKVIEDLDSSPAQERRTEVYRLRNVQANDVQTALTTFLTNEKQKITQSLGNTGIGSAQRMLEQEVAVVAVPSEGLPANSNTLLISASPRYFESVMQIIKELDKPPPQVLIQVLLAEVTLDDELDLGMDAMWTHKFGDNTGKIGTNFQTQAEIQKFNGFSVSITGGDINFFLRALATQGKVEVLSRPMVMGADNKKAMINVGEEVAFITDSRITDTNTTYNTVQYKPVGVTLNVTPRINPDGLVKMDINPKISSLSQSSVTISPGVSAPIINSREALTTVTVQDGHTIVLGGLIQTTMEDHEDKVPVLGDIPLMGLLFKKTVKIKQRKELLIILTPHVVRNVDNADCQTGKELDRLNRVLQKASMTEIKHQIEGGIIATPCPTSGPATSVPIISGWPDTSGKETPMAPQDPPAATTRPAETRIIPVETRKPM